MQYRHIGRFGLILQGLRHNKWGITKRDLRRVKGALLNEESKKQVHFSHRLDIVPKTAIERR